MGLTTRQKINRTKLGEKERVLLDAGIVQPSKFGGSLPTALGRRVIIDYLWANDDALRQAIVETVTAVADEDKVE